MAEPRQQQDMILAPNQTMYVLDRTTGEVYVYLGPCKEALAADSHPVVWDGTKFKDIPTFEAAIQQHLVASEEQYIVLRNPTQNTETMKPKRNTAVSLQTGKTVVLRGPTHLALWPGQSAQVIDGHQLDEDQYLKLRVIGPVSDKDAQWLWPLVREDWRAEDAEEVPPPLHPVGSAGHAAPAATGGEGAQTGAPDGTTPPTPPPTQTPKPTLASQPLTAECFDLGTEYIVPGSRTSFFIPPTGIIVKPARQPAEEHRVFSSYDDAEDADAFAQPPADRQQHAAVAAVAPPKDTYVRRGVPITATQYVVLVNRVGVRSYVVGPTTVIPCIDQHFAVNPKTNTPVFEAEQIDEHSGVLLRTLRALTVSEVRNRIPNVHLLGTPQDDETLPPGTQLVVWKREQLVFPVKDIDIERRFVAVHIEAGTARYVKDLRTGITRVLPGERLELLDPRVEEFVQRPLTPQQVALWFPNGGHNPELVPCIEVPQGTAALVRVKNANGQTVRSRVLRGYTVDFLQWNESLASIKVSGSRLGEPKSYREGKEFCYLWVQGNRVNDTADALLSQDGCGFSVGYTLTVDFQDGAEQQWFAVDDYVYLVCEAVRSRLRGMMLRLPIHEIATNYVEIVRDAILGEKTDDQPRPGLPFVRIGAKVVEIDVRELAYKDARVQGQLEALQQTSVTDSIKTRQSAITLDGERARLEIEGERLATQTALAEAKAKAAVEQLAAAERQQQESTRLQRETAAAKLTEELALAKQRAEADGERAELEHVVASLKQTQRAELERAETDLKQALATLGAQIAKLEAATSREALGVETERAQGIVEREVLRLEKHAASQALVVQALGAQVGADLRMLAQTEMSRNVVEALGRAAAFEGVDTMELLARFGGKVPTLAGLIAMWKEASGNSGTNGSGGNGHDKALPASIAPTKPATPTAPRA